MVSLIFNIVMLVLQAGSEGPPPPDPGGTRGPQLPIDENSWILIVFGIILGVYVLYRRKYTTNKAS